MVEAFYTKCVGSSEEYRLECGDTMRKKRMIVTGAVVFLTIAGVLCGKKLFAGKDTSDHKGTKTSGYEYYYKDNDHPEDKDVESSSEPGATKAPLIAGGIYSGRSGSAGCAV